MNRLKWALLGAFLWAAFGNLAAQQTFSKQWIYEQGRSVLARKMKASPEELRAAQLQLTMPAGAADGVSFRDLDNNISSSEKPESEVHAARKSLCGRLFCLPQRHGQLRQRRFQP